MAHADGGRVKPVRNEAEEFIRLEIQRVGPDALDRAAIARRFIERGASKTRVFEWIRAAVSDAKNPPPDTLKADLAVAEAAIAAAETAKVLGGLPSAKQVQAFAHAAADFPADAASVLPLPRVAPQTFPSFDSHSAEPTSAQAYTLDFHPPAVAPDGSTGILIDLQTAIETSKRVMDHSHGADGKVRNARMALAAAETLRRCLDSAMKMYEAINNVDLVKRFMAETLAEVGRLEPEVAKAVVKRMQVVQSRWAA